LSPSISEKEKKKKKTWVSSPSYFITYMKIFQNLKKKKKPKFKTLLVSGILDKEYSTCVPFNTI
jgi:hypothetical protein